MKRTAVLFTLLCLCLGLTLALTGCKPTQRIKIYYEYFDTETRVISYAEDSAEDFRRSCAIAEGIFERAHRLFDIYHEYSGLTNIATLNRLASEAEESGESMAPVALDPLLIDLLKYGIEMHRVTNGEMNICMGRVLALWHDCRTEALEPDGIARIPSKAELEAAAKHTDITKLEINESAGTVRFLDTGMRLDVGALGKGYAAELARVALKSAGVNSYVLDVGRNLCAVGEKPDGSGWTTHVENPNPTAEDYAYTFTLRDGSVVTSGDYERFYVVENERYHHIIDKDTLMPSEHFSSVTVICESSALADALSTALFCMPLDEGEAVLEGLDIPVKAVWIDRLGTVTERSFGH